jgi:hypothetical protein
VKLRQLLEADSLEAMLNKYYRNVPKVLYRGTHSSAKNKSEDLEMSHGIWLTPFEEHAENFAYTNALRYIGLHKKLWNSDKVKPVLLTIDTSKLKGLELAHPDSEPANAGGTFAGAWAYLVDKLPSAAIKTTILDTPTWKRELEWARNTDFEKIS